MPDARDDVTIGVKIRGATETKHDADKVARSIDNIGDQARQAARGLGVLNAQSNRTRVNFGPFSTSMRGGALAVGGLILLSKRAAPAILGTAEAVATLAGGAGAAGGVGLLALGQAGIVASLGIKDLTDALGGNAAALKRMSPEVRGLFDTLSAEKDNMREIADQGLLPGLTSGADSALKNVRVWRSVVKDTSKTLGGVAKDAGGLLGSKSFGRDLGTVGHDNAKILDSLGHAGISAADGLMQVLVEAEPLAMWLAKDVEHGAKLADVWLKNARNSGKMAKFFREARTDLSLLGSATGHTGRGLINLFGAHDVDGTKTLRNLDAITARFERWSSDPATRRNVGQAIIDEIPDAVGAVMTAVANNMPRAGGLAARTFFEGFIHADVWGKLLAGTWLASKLGAGGAAKKLLRNVLFGGGSGKGGAAAGLIGRGSTPANPLFVFDVSSGKDPGSFLKKTAKKVAPALLGAGGDALAIGAGGLAGGLVVGGTLFGVDRLGRAINGSDYGLKGNRARASQRAAVRGMGLTPTPQRVDASGFPDPHGHFVYTPGDIHLKATLVMPDGRELGRATLVGLARDNARVPNQGQPTTGRRLGP